MGRCALRCATLAALVLGCGEPLPINLHGWGPGENRSDPSDEELVDEAIGGILGLPWEKTDQDKGVVHLALHDGDYDAFIYASTRCTTHVTVPRSERAIAHEVATPFGCRTPVAVPRHWTARTKDSATAPTNACIDCPLARHAATTFSASALVHRFLPASRFHDPLLDLSIPTSVPVLRLRGSNFERGAVAAGHQCPENPRGGSPQHGAATSLRATG